MMGERRDPIRTEEFAPLPEPELGLFPSSQCLRDSVANLP